MNRPPEELDAELSALEAELRADQLLDPGSDFFAELSSEMMQEVARHPVPRRPWWRRLGALGRWAWRPAPVAVLAGAAAAVLVALLLLGDGGAELRLVTPSPTAEVAPLRRGATDVGPTRPVPTGKQWLASLPPTDHLWALQDDQLPALLAMLGDEGDAEANDVEPIPGEPVNEQSLDRLNDDALRALERLLPDAPPKTPGRRPRPSMRRPG